MSETMDVLREAHAQRGTLARKAAASRERIALTDHGHVAAVLISPDELAELEDELALLRYRLEKATGTVETVPHEQVVREARADDE